MTKSARLQNQCTGQLLNKATYFSFWNVSLDVISHSQCTSASRLRNCTISSNRFLTQAYFQTRHTTQSEEHTHLFTHHSYVQYYKQKNLYLIMATHHTSTYSCVVQKYIHCVPKKSGPLIFSGHSVFIILRQTTSMLVFIMSPKTVVSEQNLALQNYA